MLERRGSVNAWLKRLLSISMGLWALLWVGVNTGPWVLEQSPQNRLEWIHYLRTIIPLVVCLVVVAMLLSKAARHGGFAPCPNTLRPLLVYGMLAMVMGLTGPRPSAATYWAVAFLAVPLAAWLVVSARSAAEGIASAWAMNWVGWCLAGLLLVVIIRLAGDALLVETPTGASAYGILNRVDPVAGVSVSRASGMARLAAVPALVGLVMTCTTQGAVKMLWGSVALFGSLLVYWLQSRGATIGVVGAMALVLLSTGRRGRIVGTVLVVLGACFVLADTGPQSDTWRISRHLLREQSTAELRTLTGRTRDWEAAWKVIGDSPLWGAGFQADRHLLGVHIHNAYLYALLCAGLPGLMALLVAVIRSWRLYLQATRHHSHLSSKQWRGVLLAGSVVAFLSIRSVPEVGGAMFGIDLLLWVPAVALLEGIPRSGPGCVGSRCRVGWKGAHSTPSQRRDAAAAHTPRS